LNVVIRRFWRYASKVFDLPKLAADLRDMRRKPVYSAPDVWQNVALLLATGRPSLHAIEAERYAHKRRSPPRATGPPSDDTLGRVFEGLDSAPLRQMLVRINHQMKRNKALPREWNLRFAAVDGHEFFSQ
jgi:hypothetical protein